MRIDKVNFIVTTTKAMGVCEIKSVNRHSMISDGAVSS